MRQTTELTETTEIFISEKVERCQSYYIAVNAVTTPFCRALYQLVRCCVDKEDAFFISSLVEGNTAELIQYCINTRFADRSRQWGRKGR